MTRPDPVIELLAHHATTAHLAPAEEAIDATRDRVLDTVAIAIASHRDDAVRPAARLADRAGTGSATRWGTRRTAPVEAAALVNGVAVRCRDQNDAYFGQEALHPSDMIPVLVAAAEAQERSGLDLVSAILVAYDVSVTMADEWACWPNGADHVNLLTFGATAGLARLAGLDEERIAAALSIAATSMIAARQSRVGDLTDWKSWAAAHQCVNAYRAVQLAAAGADGPTAAVSGAEGFANLAVSNDVTGTLSSLADGRARLLDTHTKVYPVGYLGQGPTELALDVHRQLRASDRAPAEIADVELRTFQRAIGIMGDERKWHPRTRATADHSLPYTTAVALLDGEVGHHSYGPERFTADDIVQLLPHVRVVVDEQMTARYPEQMAACLTVRLTDGAAFDAALSWPTGNARRPMDPQALRERGRALLEEQLGPAEVDAVLTVLTDLPRVRSLASLGRALAAAGREP